MQNACLAQSVEHSAVNRSVGGSSPSTGAISTTQVVLLFLSDMGLAPCADISARTAYLDAPSEADAAFFYVSKLTNSAISRGFKSLNRRH